VKRKDLRAVGNHALKEVWEDNLALKLHALLDSMEVKWTSTDVVRIGNVEESSAPVIVWIGVMPASLSGHEGAIAAFKCRELLVEYNIADVDVEIRESVVTHTTGPKLLAPIYSGSFFQPAGIRETITTTLGLPICAQSTPWTGGTGGFFIAEGGNTKRLFLVTARHVIFTSSDKSKNNHFECTNDSQRRHNVMLFSDASFNDYLESIQKEIGSKAFTVNDNEERIASVEGKDDPVANRKRDRAQVELNRAREAVEQLNTFYQDVSKHWATPESRILGHVILSPPINVGAGGENYTEDWAIIEIDPSKVDVGNFIGNAIDLSSISFSEVMNMMCPNTRDAESFVYPWDHLLMLEGIVPDEELRHPTALDENKNPCLMVIKRGRTTGLTIGRANNIISYARFEDKTSKEWAILPFDDSKSGVFSKSGDSGSVIVDRLGRIGGLLTGGAGAMPSSDITYATPISFLLKCMHDRGLRNININPVLA
jgi:hypothetical protein